MIQDPERCTQAAAVTAVDDLKLRVCPERSRVTRHSLCLDVWELPANLIGGSGGDLPPPLKESNLLWAELQVPAD